MFNNQLQQQLQNAIKKGKIKVKYPKNYKEWKTKFDYWCNITKNSKQALEIMYGPDGGVKNYKGSLYNNSNFDIKKIKKRKQQLKNLRQTIKKPNSTIFSYLKVKNNKR